MSYLWVAVGGALGSIARYWCTLEAADLLGGTFPWGTILINVLGSFIIGFFATATGADGRFVVSDDARLFVMVGLCGGYTTFSAFSLQTLVLARTGEWAAAGANIVLSVVLCLLGVWLGHVGAASLDR